MKKNNPEYICSTHGKNKVFGKKAIINGSISLAYFEGDEIVAYLSWEELSKLMFVGGCPEIELSF